MYFINKFLARARWALMPLLILSVYTVNVAQAATLAERAVYTVKILPAGDPAEIGQCSAFSFGDISDPAAGGCKGGFVDNEVPGAPALSGGNGIPGDGLAGTLSIETDKVNASGTNTFTVLNYQMDPYLGTPGGIFKTTMTPPDGEQLGNGTLDAAGNMTLSHTGRTGVAEFFVAGIGIQPWNIDDSTKPAIPTTGLYEGFTTASDSNFDPNTGVPSLTLTGRVIGDANGDGILDAILVSAGNVGQFWGPFDGTPYSEGFNVQFIIVSAKPVANPDSLNTNQDAPLIIDEATDLLANDTHATGDPISVFAFTQPAQAGAGASVADNGNSTLTYTPAPGFSGTDSFDYTISDAGGEQDTTTVTISISAAGNNPPTANDINVETDEDTPLDVDPTTNDIDPDGDPLTITQFDPASVKGGAVIDNGNNLLTYSPVLNFNGDDSFGYTISDGNGGTDSATVFVTVNSVNDPLVCTDVAFNTAISTALDIDVANDLLSTCTDPENDPITLDSFTQPIQAGSMVASNGGTLTYTPADGFSGQDSFTYTASDGTDTDTRTVIVGVGKIFGNFTMLEAAGATFGGTNDIVSTWDGTLNTAVTETNFNMTMKSDSDHKFNGFVWSAHDMRMFGPGVYMFDTSCSTAQVQQGLADCGGAPNEFLTLTIGPGQIGAHMLFDWNTTTNIDVANLYEPDAMFTNPDPAGGLYQGAAGPTPDATCLFEWVSIDGDGDGVPGVKFIDGPFIDFRANFSQNFNQNCGVSEPIDVPRSSIKSSDPGGGCTLSAATTTPLSRGDYWVMLGLMGLLGAFVTRRRILNNR